MSDTIYIHILYLHIHIHIHMSEYRDDADESNPVEKKRKTKKNVTIPKNPDWKGFFSGCLSNLTLTMLLALIGANFLYLTSLGYKSRGYLFPSLASEYFAKQTGGQCTFYERAKNGVLGDKTKFKLGKLGIPPSSGWPYSMKTDDTIDFTAQGFKNWFALSTSDVYYPARTIIKLFLEFFKKENDNMFSSDLVQIILINALLIFVAPLLPFVLLALLVAVFISFCMRAWNADLLFFLFVTFIGPAFWLSCGLTGVMALQAILTLLVLPLYIDGKAVFDIMKCNGFLFTTTFLLLTTFTASKNHLPPGLIGGLAASIALALYRTLKK